MSDVLSGALAAEAAAVEQLASVPEWMWDGETLPVPVDTLADSHYGMLVREREELGAVAGLPGAQVSGLLLPGPREIWVDEEEARRAPVRRRFTIGHELGHWVLHCDLGGNPAAVVQCRTESLSEEGAVEEDAGRQHLARPRRFPLSEIEANQFAAAMLMPRLLVEREHAWVDGDLWRLAQAFGVSTVAMKRRLWFLSRASPA
jgi:IrrE N-terminal-like domain